MISFRSCMRRRKYRKLKYWSKTTKIKRLCWLLSWIFRNLWLCIKKLLSNSVTPISISWMNIIIFVGSSGPRNQIWNLIWMWGKVWTCVKKISLIIFKNLESVKHKVLQLQEKNGESKRIKNNSLAVLIFITFFSFYFKLTKNQWAFKILFTENSKIIIHKIEEFMLKKIDTLLDNYPKLNE